MRTDVGSGAAAETSQRSQHRPQGHTNDQTTDQTTGTPSGRHHNGQPQNGLFADTRRRAPTPHAATQALPGRQASGAASRLRLVATEPPPDAPPAAPSEPAPSEPAPADSTRTEPTRTGPAHAADAADASVAAVADTQPTAAPKLEPTGTEPAPAEPVAADRLGPRLAALIGTAAYERFFLHDLRLEPGVRGGGGQVRALRPGAGGGGADRADTAGTADDGDRADGACSGLTVRAASSFLLRIVEDRFMPALEQLAAGGPVRLVEDARAFRRPSRSRRSPRVAASSPGGLGPSAGGERVPASASPNGDGPARRPAGPSSSPRLEDFVVGESNRLAYHAACAIADPRTDPRSGGLLVLHGGCGLGKTHLLRGVAAAYGRDRGRASARYVTAETFTNGFLTALRTRTTDRFREQYRRVELLCIDDVHFLATKEATRAELVHTLDQIVAGGSRLAIASDEHPRAIEGLGRQLISRLLSGLIIELGPPEPELCRTMVHRLAQRRGLVLGPQVAAAIADAAGGGAHGPSFRDLAGALARVQAFHEMLAGGADATRTPVTALTVRRALGESASVRAAPAVVRIDDVVRGVCEALGVGPAEFAGRGRHRRVVLARALVVHLGRELTTASYPEIARAMGRPNHSSVITAHQRLRRQIAEHMPVDAGCPWDGAGVGEVASRLASRLRGGR